MAVSLLGFGISSIIVCITEIIFLLQYASRTSYSALIISIRDATHKKKRAWMETTSIIFSFLFRLVQTHLFFHFILSIHPNGKKKPLALPPTYPTLLAQKTITKEL
jgi:hypothetical protein